MKYYLVPEPLASRLNVKAFRHGSTAIGYIVTVADIAAIGVDEAMKQGALEISEKKAISIINKL